MSCDCSRKHIDRGSKLHMCGCSQTQSLMWTVTARFYQFCCSNLVEFIKVCPRRWAPLPLHQHFPFWFRKCCDTLSVPKFFSASWFENICSHTEMKLSNLLTAIITCWSLHLGLSEWWQVGEWVEQPPSIFNQRSLILLLTQQTNN